MAERAHSAVCPPRAQVRMARQHSLQILLVHELDPSRDGCAFENFFKTTPQDLINDGLYSSIAMACHGPPHREVSRACHKSSAAVLLSLTAPG